MLNLSTALVAALALAPPLVPQRSCHSRTAVTSQRNLRLARTYPAEQPTSSRPASELGPPLKNSAGYSVRRAVAVRIFAAQPAGNKAPATAITKPANTSATSIGA